MVLANPGLAVPLDGSSIVVIVPYAGDAIFAGNRWQGGTSVDYYGVALGLAIAGVSLCVHAHAVLASLAIMFAFGGLFDDLPTCVVPAHLTLQTTPRDAVAAVSALRRQPAAPGPGWWPVHPQPDLPRRPRRPPAEPAVRAARKHTPQYQRYPGEKKKTKSL
eukprot:SAG22_NODE_138_length_18031_cov_5.796621_9_plen_162_part_00